MKRIDLIITTVPLIFIIAAFTGMFMKKPKLEVLGTFCTMNCYVLTAIFEAITGKSPGSSVIMGLIWFWSWKTVKNNKFPRNAKRKHS